MPATPGFDLLNHQPIAELNTQARLYRHTKTGATVLSLENQDENKVFGINFRTIPNDNTGVPHILEHSVLCGSRKYPVKEPFVELIKGSLNTFLNAFTYPDRTCYPVASQNTQDLNNLMDVYLDAVFYPILSRPIFEQEGWHYELDAPDAPLSFKGVVYNEMKGAYSAPESLLAKHTQEALFPDTAYGVDSGGDPPHILNLTYEQLVEFHRTHYHPSNAFIYLYGDDDHTARLNHLNDWLNAFDASQPAHPPTVQPPFDQPRSLQFSYPKDPESPDAKAMLTVNWLLPETTDNFLNLSLNVLDHVLLGTPAAPLRKALIESGLGENLAGGGLSDELRQMTFSTGLKGVAPENTAAVEALVLETLQHLAETGIDPKQIEATLNTIEFQLREYNTGSFPRGLALMLDALTAWNYGADPIAALAFEQPLSELKTTLVSQPRYLESLITQHLIQNPHRVTLALQPDDGMAERLAAAEQARLKAAEAELTDADRQTLAENTHALKLAQETPDSPEGLASIPTLTIGDLDRENKPIPTEQAERNGTRFLYHDLFTNGITYLDLVFNLQSLPLEDLPYLSLYGRALLELGTTKEDFVSLSQRIGRETGGLGISPSVLGRLNADDASVWLVLRGKATLSQTGELLNIINDVLLHPQFDQPERFKQMVLEEKARLEARLVPAGHIVAITRLRAKLTRAGWLSEHISGISYLQFVRQLAEQIDSDWPSVLSRLQAVHQRAINRQALIANLTLPANDWPTVNPQLDALFAALPAHPATPLAWPIEFDTTNEALTIPAQVNYVAKGANLNELGVPYHGAQIAINKYLNTTWIWEKVRVQGGAYGGFAVHDRISGSFAYASYRDPNLLATLENYDGTATFLRDLELSPSELERAIIGAIGDLDAYQLPDAKGYTALVRHLVGDDDHQRQQMRNELLNTSAADFRNFAEALNELNQVAPVVVLGGAAAIQAASAEKPDLFAKTTRVL